MNSIQIRPIHSITKLPPRELLPDAFRSLREGLPIRGGWGYSMENACIIDKNDPTVIPGLPFDGVSVEYVFAEKRIYLELIVLRKREDWYAGIEKKLISQQLIRDGNRSYDKLTFSVTAHKDSDYNQLKEDWEKDGGPGRAGFDIKTHKEKHESLMAGYTAEYFFDITSFHGK